MLDPKEQAKGGFRAHAERENARRDARAEARREAGAAADTTADVPAPVEAQADGAPSLPQPLAPGEQGPSAPPTGRQPKRWR